MYTRRIIKIENLKVMKIFIVQDRFSQYYYEARTNWCNAGILIKTENVVFMKVFSMQDPFYTGFQFLFQLFLYK